MKLEEKILSIIDPPMNYRGYEIVQVRVIGGKCPVIAIDLDRLDGSPVLMDDCENANRLISAILDVEDFINGSYNLEVSSPGENRPLRKISEFERFCGRDAKVETRVVVNGRRKFRGKLVRVEQNSQDAVVYLKEECNTESIEVGVLHSNIKKAVVKRF
ncbi:MAG: ribosome maturation factor RimP [Holosporaceae bacterium]|jgi:ribosome maturation factor RimP|nr:ribosome maturation factor RimP [Holosporaceae bacterium]